MLTAIIEPRLAAAERRTGESADYLREMGASGVEANLGRKGMVDLALGIAGTRVFPTVKRALGYATSCALWPVGV